MIFDILLFMLINPSISSLYLYTESLYSKPIIVNIYTQHQPCDIKKMNTMTFSKLFKEEADRISQALAPIQYISYFNRNVFCKNFTWFYKKVKVCFLHCSFIFPINITRLKYEKKERLVWFTFVKTATSRGLLHNTWYSNLWQ